MKILSGAVIFILTLILWLTIHQYFFCPRFSFVEPTPFSGYKLYNPYAAIDSTEWLMCNFHAHSNAWKGFTNGKGTPHDIWKAYDSLGYAVHAVSDYHKVDLTHEYEPNFIPAYEHGFNIKKVHYLILGDQKVNWLDYIFPQIPSNKQWVLNELTKNSDNLIVLNHPDIRNGFENEDLKYLSNYQLMEVLSPSSVSLDKWDAALSSGKPVFIVANDDVHDIFDKRSVGRFCTWVNTNTSGKDDVLASMKDGNSYGMLIPEIADEDFRQKIKRFKTKLPRLNSFQLKDGIIHVAVDKRPKEINFTGKHGQELSRVTETKNAHYIIKETDPYVRTTITFHDGTKIFLNPVFRYADKPFTGTQPIIDEVKSRLLIFLGGLILLFWGWLMYQLLTARLLKKKVASFPGWFTKPYRG